MSIHKKHDFLNLPAYNTKPIPAQCLMIDAVDSCYFQSDDYFHIVAYIKKEARLASFFTGL